MLESLCFQTRDVLDVIKSDCDLELKELRVDGGASGNNLLMQIQSDVLNLSVCRPDNVELTAYGAALAAAFGAGIINDLTQIQTSQKVHRFEPNLTESERENKYKFWKKAVSRSQNWL